MKTRFRFYAWSVLLFHLLVVLWGAVVRASGSGAGCGEHWPLCNGQIIPRAPLNATLIEFVHRCTSGIALVSVLILAIWAFRVYPRRYGIRGAALLALASTLAECAIGAALVLLRLVGSNDSLSRGLWLAAHQVNTLFLLAALSVTAWQATVIRRREARHRGALALPVVGYLCAAILGSFAAVGDTLTVSTSLREGIQADFSAFSNIFVRLRILHPIVAGALGVWLLVLARQRAPFAKRLSGAIAALVLSQFALGIANIMLGTPTWLQLLHLLCADLLWIAYVLLGFIVEPSPSRLAARSVDMVRDPRTERSPGWSIQVHNPTRVVEQ
jgi:cytochrome c oxidase assembly protein subunit 15